MPVPGGDSKEWLKTSVRSEWMQRTKNNAKHPTAFIAERGKGRLIYKEKE